MQNKDIKAARTKAGLKTHLEATPVGDHQANGDAESAISVIRPIACTFLQQLRDKSGETIGVGRPAESSKLWVHNHTSK